MIEYRGKSMQKEDTRQYWEDYVTYWLAKVKESNEHNPNTKDTTVDDQILYTYVSKLDIEKDDRLLDYGCGFCRLYPFIKNLPKEHVQYHGVDIAQSPLDYALELYPELSGKLKTLEEERIPYEANTFDKLICFGVLDACHQEETVLDIIKVLKVGGKALITGKNHLYEADDELAMTAEINARKKGHPNYFTNVTSLIEQLKERNVEIEQAYYFKRRGDFVNDQYTLEKPERFYEFALVVKKQQEEIKAFDTFSSKYSDTFNEQNNHK